MFEQREKQIALLKQSELNWTALRLPRLVNGAGNGDYKLGYPQMSAKLIATRQDLASAMLHQLVDTDWVGQAPIIADKKAFSQNKG